jgi:LPS O-antigen subunit length determinant protein (WzzB/FepE family)
MNKAVTLTSDNEIDLADLWQTLWSGRWFIVTTTAIFTATGVAYALLATEWYKAEVVLAPANQQSLAGGGIAGLGALGGLAALAGVSVPAASEQHPVAVLKSQDFARGFIEELQLMPVLLKDVTATEPLDLRDAVEEFDTRVRGVTEDARAGLVTLSVRWKDADTAALWANAFARRLNDQLRQQAAEEAERNVAYLKKEMAATSVVSLQQSMGSLLEAEMQKLLLARGNEEFAFKVIDRAVAPKKRDSPKRALIVVVAFLTGTFTSILLLTLYKAVRGESRA